jgi:hypothetical protein
MPKPPKDLPKKTLKKPASMSRKGWPKRFRHIELSPRKQIEIDPMKYGLVLSPFRRKNLTAKRNGFLEVLRTEFRKNETIDRIPADFLDRIFFSSEIDRRTLEFNKLLDKKTSQPLWIHDLFALKGIQKPYINREPLVYKTPGDYIKSVLNPKEAYLVPLSDSKGRHYLTFVHVGELTTEKKMQDMARYLLSDPTGRVAKNRFRRNFHEWGNGYR